MTVAVNKYYPNRTTLPNAVAGALDKNSGLSLARRRTQFQASLTRGAEQTHLHSLAVLRSWLEGGEYAE